MSYLRKEELVVYKTATNPAKTETRRAVIEYEEFAKLMKKTPKAFYRQVNSKPQTRTELSDLKKKIMET